MEAIEQINGVKVVLDEVTLNSDNKNVLRFKMYPLVGVDDRVFIYSGFEVLLQENVGNFELGKVYSLELKEVK